MASAAQEALTLASIFVRYRKRHPISFPGKPSDICQRTSAMTDYILQIPLSRESRVAAPSQAVSDRNDGVVADLLCNAGLFADFSLERWLDWIERREERA
jgi:hypothetical protein